MEGARAPVDASPGEGSCLALLGQKSGRQREKQQLEEAGEREAGSCD